MIRSAIAIWTGTVKDGKGEISTESGAVKGMPYTFKSRFNSGVGTNPEELIAAAHASCFTMALANALGAAGYRPDRLETKASLLLEGVGGTPSVVEIRLDTAALVPGIDAAGFERAALEAKKNCPVSKLLNTTIVLEARLLERSSPLRRIS